VKAQPRASVAVLLATYNGARFLEPQIRSLKENAVPFTLHWLDDHSNDDTREALRALTRSVGIELHEWHQPQHLGVPGAFFQLLECVDADFYLFCDQDDIWQPGKIDTTVANLFPDIDSPVICCSDPFVFDDRQPEVLHRLSDLIGARPPIALQETRMFMPIVGPRSYARIYATVARVYTSGTKISLVPMRGCTTGGCLLSRSRQVHSACLTMYRQLSTVATATTFRTSYCAREVFLKLGWCNSGSDALFPGKRRVSFSRRQRYLRGPNWIGSSRLPNS